MLELNQPTRQIRLILSADDFGLSRSVNRGIAEAFQAGVISSAGILACGGEFDDAVAIARAHRDLDVGIHLALDEERPVLPPDEIPSLVQTNGLFHSRRVLLKRLLIAGSIEQQEIRAEFAAQIRRCLDAGLNLSHFNGHGHIHVYPRIRDSAIAAAREFGIRSCRIPCEPIHVFGRPFRIRAYLRKLLVRWLARGAAAKFRQAGFEFPDAFRGLIYGGRLSKSSLEHVVNSLPRGKIVEVMTHPGRYNEAELAKYAHWKYSWEMELEALLSLREVLHNDKTIEQISFRVFRDSD